MKGSRMIANQFLQKQWDLRQLKMHKTRIKRIKSSNYTKGPPKFSHISANRKKQQMLEDRYTEIERENRILLEKMSKVFQPRSRSTARCTKRSKLFPISRESRRPIFKRKIVELGGREMEIELEEKGNSFVLRVKDRGNKHELNLSRDEVFEFVGNNYEKIFDKISLDNGEIVLNY